MGTRDATLLMSQTMSHSRRKSARRTSERAASSSMRRLLSMRQSLCAELLSSKTVMSKDLKSVELNMSPSAGPSRKFMMLRMMLFLVLLRLRRSVKMKLLAIPPTPSVPSGPRKCAVLRRRLSRSTLPSPDAPRNPGRSVLLLDVDSRKEKRNVSTRPRRLFRMLPRNSVLLSPNVPASMSPNWCLNLSPRRNVLMSLRRSALGPEPTQGRSRSQLSRNGATFLQRNPDLLKADARTFPKQLRTYDGHKTKCFKPCNARH